MAQIRKSYNELEEKYNTEKQAYYARVQVLNEAVAANNRVRRKSHIIIGLLFIGFFILMIRRPEISKAVQRWVTEFFAAKFNQTASMEFIFYIPESIRSMHFLLRLVLGFLCVVLRFLLSAVLGILSLLLGRVLRLLMYVIPATGPLILLRALFEGSSEYPFGDIADTHFMKDLCDGQDADIIKAGLAGEQAALDCMSRLDDDCYVFANLHIPYEGKESETDLIVVSPAGVTIVEVKNHKGVIRGDVSDRELIQDKGRRDDLEDKRFYNPVKQVATHAYRLAGYLRSRNQPLHVRTCVFFVNPACQLQLSDHNGITKEQCPVFHVAQKEQMLRYLQYSPKPLSDRAYERSVELLEELMK